MESVHQVRQNGMEVERIRACSYELTVSLSDESIGNKW